MNRLLLILGLTSSLALHAADGDIIATTGSAASFKFNTSEESPFAMASSAAATALFAELPVTWRAGETVGIEAPDGTETTVSTASSGIYAFSPSSSGVWSLLNSEGGKVYVSIPWAVTGGAVCTSGLSVFAVDTKEDGPNRKSHKREILPIAYSGDSWCRCKYAVSTLTFTSPQGTATSASFVGSGAVPVTLKQTGDWGISLVMADGTALDGNLTLLGSGLIISFH